MINKQYKLRLDLKFKCHNSKMKFDEFDKNTSDFYINLTKDNEVIDIDNAILTLVALKPDGTTESQFLKVKENKVYCNLKESMKDVVGEYSCMAMLTLKDKVIIVEQPISYTINENKLLRALNREVEGTERFSLLTDMLSRLSDIENSEKIRISNESDRLLLQKTLEDLIKEIEEAELDRKNHEVLREKTHQKLKEEIKKSETINANTEATNNVAKELIDSVNITHEEIKKTNKDTKAVLESTREFENEARENEEDRQKLYGNAQITLKELKNSEVVRERNENTRISNEEARKLKISNFETRYNNLIEITETLKSELSELNSQSETNEANRVDAENLRNQRYEEFETAYNSLIYDIQSQLENTNTVKANLISKVNNAKDDMTLTVQTALDNLTKKVDSKIVEVNNAKNEMIRQANDTVAKANQSIGQVNAISNKANETNSKVNEALVKTTKCIDDVNKTKDDLVNQFNALAPSEQSNAEVQLARTDIAGKTHNSLQERLIADNKMQNMLFEEVEGSYITTETVPSNIQEVEIFGNTYQDPNTLEIFSIGKEIEGTSGVKIDISSCNKNLFDKAILANIDLKNNSIVEKDGRSECLKSTIPATLHNFDVCRHKFKESTSYSIQFDMLYERTLEDGKAQGLVIGIYYTDGTGMTVYPSTSYNNWLTAKATSSANKTIQRISFSYGVNTLTYLDLDTLQIEENAQSTEYVKHEEDNKEIILPCKLDGFESSKDRFYYDGSEWIIEKNNNFKIIDGSETWIISKTKENTILFALDDTTNTSLTKDLPQSEINCIGNKVKSYTLNNLWNIDKEGIALGGSVYVLRVAVNKSKLSTLDADGFKKLLKQWYDEGNPLTICYKSESQIIHTGYTDPNLLSLRTFEDKTHIYFADDTGEEGTIKCKVPKSLGASVSANAKQIEGVTQELENVKSLVDTVGTMEISSDTGFVTIDNTIDGYIDDVEVRGKSLVNLLKPTAMLNSEWVQMNQTLRTITNTKITVINNTDRVIRIQTSNIDGSYKSSQNIQPNSNIFINIDELTKFRMIQAHSSEGWEITNETIDVLKNSVMILEGDHTNNPPSYFEGIMSVGQDKEIEVLSCNENLFDINNLISGSVQTGDGMDVDDVTKCKTDFTKLPIGTYSLSKNTEEWSTCLAYDEYKRYIGTLFNNRNKENTFTINNTHKYIRFKFDYTLEYATTDNIQLEKGSNTSSYTHHQSNKRTLLKPIIGEDRSIIYEPIVMRGVWDGDICKYADIVKEVNNKYYLTENCGEREYQEGDENNPDLLTDMTRTVYKLDTPIITELPYDLNLRTFANQSNFIVNAGAINPILKFNIKNCLANTVKSLMNKVQVIEESFNKIVIEGFRKVLAGDMQSLAYMVYDMKKVEQEETNKLIEYLPAE